MKKIYLLLLLLAGLYRAHAQIDLQCDGRDQHSIYVLVAPNGFYRIDSVDTHPTNPIFLHDNAVNAYGIAIASNLDAGTSGQTMYMVSNTSTYFYLQDTTWINTGHQDAGDGANPGGSASYIYNQNISGEVYRYDGKGNSTLLVGDLNTFGYPIFDIATDTASNFYIFYAGTNQIVMFNPDGLPVDTLLTNNTPSPGGLSLPGLAILGQTVYVVIDNKLYSGPVVNHGISFTMIKDLSSLPNMVGDIATCSYGSGVISGFKNIEVPHFAVYPNPATGSATVKLNNTAQLQVTSLLGQPMLTVNTGSATQYQLPLTGWPAGVYIVTAYNATGASAHSTLVVQ